MLSFWENLKTRSLRKKIDASKLPLHIAIITDGNGRWAEKRGLPRIVGHRQGVEAIRTTVEEAAKVGIKYLTFYSFSTENWARPQEEVQGLMGLFEEMVNKEVENLKKNGVKLQVIGRWEGLPEKVRQAMVRAIEETKEGQNITLSLALNYGGRAEILDALKKIASQSASADLIFSLDEQNFRKYLYQPDLPDPDLLIRTAGEYRISNFLLWQIAYTELWVTSVLWPDFKPHHLLQAIFDFQRRKRKFGRI